MIEVNRVHRPHPRRYMKKLDCSHSLHGIVMGLIVLFISIATLSAFFGEKTDSISTMFEGLFIEAMLLHKVEAV